MTTAVVPMSDSEKLQRLEQDVQEHGEVHATIAEVGERDIRQGTATFDHDAGLVTVEDGQTVHRIDAAEIVHWYLPAGF